MVKICGVYVCNISGGIVDWDILYEGECHLFHCNIINQVSCYNIVRCSADGTGIMFLNEAALGKEHIITVDDSTLTSPPSGYDSVLAKGRTEPG